MAHSALRGSLSARTRLILVVGGACAAVASFALACVSEDSGPLGNDAGIDASDGSSSDATTTNDGPANIADAGSDGTSPTVNRSVVCEGNAPCTGLDLCCGSNNDWLDAGCHATCAGNYELGCDDATDCPPGLICCMQTDQGRRAAATSCKPSCPHTASQRQLCRLNPPSTECNNRPEDGGTVCTSLTIFAPDGLATCGPFPPN